MTKHFRRPEHASIGRLLQGMRTGFLLDAECWFGGGTAVVMKHAEYRLSLDVDFLCSSQAGYRTLRQAVTARGAAALFETAPTELRAFRCDQYGLRTMLEFEGRPIKLEIVREGRITLEGALDEDLGCPLLALDDQFAEKLLANSDRGKDPSICYRDALDLGVLIMAGGDRIPKAASAKAAAAYGQDVWRDAKWVVDYLRERPAEIERAVNALQMDLDLAHAALLALEKALAVPDGQA